MIKYILLTLYLISSLGSASDLKNIVIDEFNIKDGYLSEWMNLLVKKIDRSEINHEEKIKFIFNSPLHDRRMTPFFINVKNIPATDLLNIMSKQCHFAYRLKENTIIIETNMTNMVGLTYKINKNLLKSLGCCCKNDITKSLVVDFLRRNGYIHSIDKDNIYISDDSLWIQVLVIDHKMIESIFEVANSGGKIVYD